MAPDTIRIRLHLRLIRAVTVLVDSLSELQVEVTSTRSWSPCPDCAAKCRRVHDTRVKKVGDLPMSGRAVTLRWRRRRFICDLCHTRHLESHPEIEGSMTRRMARQLVADARVMPIRAVARRHGVSWHVIMAIVTAWAGQVQTHRRARRCRVLLIDETSIRRRHRYVTVLMNGDTGEVLAMVAHRDAAAVCGFLATQTHRWRRGVKVVATDGSKAYKTAIDTMLPHSRHVLDRFHVVRWFAAGLTGLRRDLQRRPDHARPPAFEPDLFRNRFVMLKHIDRIEPAEATRLLGLFDTHPELESGWRALQALYAAYSAEDHDAAQHQLDIFARLHATGQIPAFDKVVEIIDRWETEILAFHHPDVAGMSNGRLEGTNNKLQVLRRVAHGFTNTTNFEARGILACPAMT